MGIQKGGLGTATGEPLAVASDLERQDSNMTNSSGEASALFKVNYSPDSDDGPSPENLPPQCTSAEDRPDLSQPEEGPSEARHAETEDWRWSVWEDTSTNLRFSSETTLAEGINTGIVEKSAKDVRGSPTRHGATWRIPDVAGPWSLPPLKRSPSTDLNINQTYKRARMTSGSLVQSQLPSV